ncbi:MAG TPA: T9SS type A sorting domain-containing protein [Chitinophagaceae bacterium]|nr:T9SS type A sorting domain-containing protein [Chitinophagaceae bacterium]
MKKQLLLILLLVNCLISFSQTNTITLEDTNLITTQRWRDTCFGLIDKSAAQIPSGYLMDYSLVSLNDSSFNGSYNSNDTIAESGDFFALHSMFTSAKVNSNGTLPASTDTLFIDAYRYLRNTGYVPLLFLYQPYQKIRPTALSQGLFTLTPDSIRLKDVSGRGSSPYDTKTFFAFSPLQSSITQFNNITFALPSEFWLMNGITSVSIDFGDGNGFQTLSKNGTVSIYYNTEGIKYLTAKITTSYGTLTAKSSIKYQRRVTYTKADTTWNISVPPVYTSFDQYLGNPQTPTGSGCVGGSIFDSINCDIDPGAIVHIVNGCDRVFDKPIIIVEGFDPLNEINYAFLQKNFGFYHFYDYMRTLGYDFVFVDFTKNTDFIENNAKVLEQVIDNVNALKTGANTSTIIGWSMGGLVARWCLKDMEDRGINHKVGKFFSYDAPQQGANIPLGLQFMFSEMINDMPWLKWFSKDLRMLSNAYNSPAAREMLVTKAMYGSDFYPLLYTLDPVRAAFAQALINKGYPHQCVNYGIAFGRGNNTSGTTNAGDGAQFGNFGPGSDIFDGNLIYLLENVRGSCYAVPVNSTNTICSYKYYGVKVAKIFGVPVLPSITLKIRNFKYHGQYPYDDGPGGYDDTQNQFAQNFTDAATVFGLQIFGAGTTNNHIGHAFIPVASALDLQNQGYSSSNLYQSDNMYGNIDNSLVNPGQVAGNTLNPGSLSLFNYVMTYTSDCGGETCQSWDDEFSAFEGANWNLHHEAPVSQQAALFMERKILNTNPSPTCPSLCNNTDYHITSDASPICNTTMLHLSSAYPIDYNINWTFPNGLLSIQNGQGTPDVTVKAIGIGIETATAVVTNACGQQATYTLQVTVGNALTGTINQGGNLTPMNTVNYISSGATSVTFQWAGVTGINCYQSSTNPPVSQTGFIYYPSQSKFWFTLSSGQSITVSFSGTGCNGTTNATRNFTVSGHYYIVIPNPATSSITISPSSQSNNMEASDIQSASGIRLVTISDVTGVVKQRQQFGGNTNTVQVDVSNLPQGAYFIQISNGSSVDTQQLLISR